MTRQLDYPPVNAPIPGSTRDRVQRQAAKVLELPVRVPTPEVKSHGAGKAWGDVASSTGYALALTLRSKRLRWTVRVLSLVLWFIVPTPISGLITLVWLAWMVVGVAGWVKRATRKGKGVDACTCKC